LIQAEASNPELTRDARFGGRDEDRGSWQTRHPDARQGISFAVAMYQVPEHWGDFMM
jgi:hypothetical protein